MNRFKLLFLFAFLSGCSIFDAGTLGTFQQWAFPISKAHLEKSLSIFFQKNPVYIIPNKWKDFDDWEERGYGSLDGKIIYFNNNPEEMYYISYYEVEANSFGNDNDFAITILSVRAVNNGDSRWKTKEDFKETKEEINRIDTRFYEKVISNLEKITSVKAEKSIP